MIIEVMFTYKLTCIKPNSITINLDMKSLSVFIFYLLMSSVSSVRPNIVVIMADDLGWNDVSFHGSDQIPTPNIDALAYSGVILNRHYTLPICTPSRSAFMTGKYPIRIGMQGKPLKCGEPRGLPLNETLLPQRLQDLGYTTRLVGKWHLGYHHSEYTPTKRGFHSHFGYWNGYIGYFDYKIDQGEFIGYDLRRDLNMSWTENGKYATDIFTQEAVHLISSHDENKPLFLQVAHLAVHSGRDSQLLEVPNMDEAHQKFKYIQDPQRRLFAEMTTKLDESVGKIVTALKDKGILNNTVIIFLSDNGAQTIGSHQNWGSNWPLRGLKFTLFEGGVRGVAALWSSTLKNPYKLSSHLMHIVDWYPTIYSMAGGDVTELGKIDGIDQWSYLTEDSNGIVPRKGVLINIGDEDNIEGIIDGKWKLVQSTYNNGSYDDYFGEDGRGFSNPSYNIDMILASPVFNAIESLESNAIKNKNHMVVKVKQLRNEAMVSCSGTERQHSQGPYCPTYCLFDIENDPCEEKNIFSSHPTIVEYLKNKLEKFKNEMVPELNKPVSSAADPRFYNNTWVSWLDEKYINQLKLHKTEISRSESNILKPYICYFLSLVIVIYL